MTDNRILIRLFAYDDKPEMLTRIVLLLFPIAWIVALFNGYFSPLTGTCIFLVLGILGISLILMRKRYERKESPTSSQDGPRTPGENSS